MSEMKSKREQMHDMLVEIQEQREQTLKVRKTAVWLELKDDNPQLSDEEIDYLVQVT
jgi:hypothetical protein